MPVHRLVKGIFPTKNSPQMPFKIFQANPQHPNPKKQFDLIPKQNQTLSIKIIFYKYLIRFYSSVNLITQEKIKDNLKVKNLLNFPQKSNGFFTVFPRKKHNFPE